LILPPDSSSSSTTKEDSTPLSPPPPTITTTTTTTTTTPDKEVFPELLLLLDPLFDETQCFYQTFGHEEQLAKIAIHAAGEWWW